MTALTLVTPAAALDLLEPARAHLRLGTDRSHDERIQDQLLPAAVAEFETVTDRQLLKATWALTLSAFPSCGWIELPKPPLLPTASLGLGESRVVVTYRDTAGTTQTLASTAYDLSVPSGPTAPRALLSLAYGQSWPSTYQAPDAVTVTIMSGYGTAVSSVPAMAQTAILLLVEGLFDEADDKVRQTADRLMAKFVSRPVQRR